MRRSVFGAKPRGVKVASVATLGVTMWRSGQDVPGRLPRAGLEVALCIVGDLNKCSGTAGGFRKAVLYFWTSIRFKTITRIGKGKRKCTDFVLMERGARLVTLVHFCDQ